MLFSPMYTKHTIRIVGNCPREKLLNVTQSAAGTGGLGTLGQQKKKGILPDHRPLCLNADDYYRVKQIPKKKVSTCRITSLK